MKNLVNIVLPVYERSIKVYWPKNNLRNLRNDEDNYENEIQQFNGYDLTLNCLNGIVVENSKYFISNSIGSFSDGYGDVNTSISELDKFFILDKSNIEYSLRCWDLALEIRNSHMLTIIFDKEEKVVGVLNHAVRKKFFHFKNFKENLGLDLNYPNNLIVENIRFHEFE